LRSCIRRVLAACALLLTVNSDAPAQVVIGELIGADNGRPLPGTLVTLVDSAGMRWARYVTNAAGRFILQPNTPGRYIIRAERIGYQVAVSPLLTVTDTLRYRFVIQPLPVQLPEIDVASRERGCARRPDGPAVAALWNEIRKALDVAQWTAETGGLTYTGHVYQTTIDPERQLLRDAESTAYSARSHMPFVVASPAELASRGFSRPNGTDVYLLGPDATILTSQEFLDTHCFGLTADARAPGMIGLSFEPLRRRSDIVDIAGTLWVDRASAALRRLEYEYTNLPRPMSQFGATGNSEFMRLNNGLWIISRWRIEAPEMEARADGGRMNVVKLGAIESGGFVTSASDGETLLHAAPRGRTTIEGVARASPRGEPLHDARVFLAGTEFEAVSDSAGRFRIDSIPPGRYALTFFHDLVKDVPIPVAVDSLHIRADTTIVRDVSMPATEELFRTLCPRQRVERGRTGLIYGVVYDQRGEPIPGADVRADWKVVGSDRNVDDFSWQTRTDALGRYYLCSMPLENDIVLRKWVVADGLRRSELSVEVRVDRSAPPIMRVDFR
jgi:hypothetical protein